MATKFYLTPVLWGGLGNRLFLIASAYAIAKEQGKILIQTEVHQCAHQTVGYDDIISLPRKEIPIMYTFTEPDSGYYTKLEIPNYPGNTRLKGYFQNENYFSGYREEILNLFRMPDHTKVYLLSTYPKIKESYFIHIRRGDYVPLGNCLDYENYLSRAFMYTETNNETTGPEHYYLVSDDLEWCRGLKCFFRKNITFVDDNEVRCLYLMSMCYKGGIGCNSTFSWWGYYLNPNPKKIGVFPDRWFQHVPRMDINPKGTICI